MAVSFSLRLLAFLGLSASFMTCAAQQVTPSPSTPSSPAASYPDSSEKLRLLLDKMLLAAKKDRRQLQSMIQEMEIPESWFTTTFGEEKGGSWVETYQEGLEENEKVLEETMMQLARAGGTFVIEKGGTRKKYDLNNHALDGYRASYSTTPQAAITSDSQQGIGDFFFSHGKFLWDSTVVTITASPGAMNQETPRHRPGNEEIRRLAANAPKCPMTHPERTKEAQAAKVQGSILMEGTVGIDGRVTDIHVLRSLGFGLDEVAVEMVKNWICTPGIGLDGKPAPTKLAFEFSFFYK